MIVKQFNDIYKIRTLNITSVLFDNIVKRKAGYSNTALTLSNDDILTFLYLREIHKLNEQKLDSDVLFLPF